MWLDKPQPFAHRTESPIQVLWQAEDTLECKSRWYTGPHPFGFAFQKHRNDIDVDVEGKPF